MFSYHRILLVLEPYKNLEILLIQHPYLIRKETEAQDSTSQTLMCRINVGIPQGTLLKHRILSQRSVVSLRYSISRRLPDGTEGFGRPHFE